MLGTQSDVDLVRQAFGEGWKCWRVRAEDDEDLDVLVVADGTAPDALDEEAELVFLLSHGDSELALRLASEGKTVVLKGASSMLQLRVLSTWLMRSWHERQLELTLLGPVAHDARGAIGIIHLASQLLEQKGAPAPTIAKLRTASQRLGLLLEEIRAVVPLRLRGALPIADGENWLDLLEEQVAVMRHARRDRTICLDVHVHRPEDYSKTHAVGIALGVLDAALHGSTSSSSVALEVNAREQGLVVRATAEQAALTPGMAAQIDLSPSEWELPKSRDVPPRFLNAALMAQQLGGRISIRSSSSGLEVEADLPPRREPHPN